MNPSLPSPEVAKETGSSLRVERFVRYPMKRSSRIGKFVTYRTFVRYLMIAYREVRYVSNVRRVSGRVVTERDVRTYREDLRVGKFLMSVSSLHQEVRFYAVSLH